MGRMVRIMTDILWRILAFTLAAAWAYDAAVNYHPSTDSEMQAECLRRLPLNRPESECDL